MLAQACRLLPLHLSGFITESEVATALKVSRTGVREAMPRPEAEGFMQIPPKKGAHVPPISDEETTLGILGVQNSNVRLS